MADPNFLQPVYDDNEEGQPAFLHRRARLGRQAGAEHLGASLYELPPGSALCPYHWHAVEEEMAIAVTGRPTVRTTRETRQMETGEVVVFHTGPDGAHQLLNQTDEPVRILFLSQHSQVEICGYPDSRKIIADALDFEVSFMFREADEVDYYDGEPPAEPSA
jgi:uncharacterized cupin superfamily protein